MLSALRSLACVTCVLSIGLAAPILALAHAQGAESDFTSQIDTRLEESPKINVFGRVVDLNVPAFILGEEAGSLTLRIALDDTLSVGKSDVKRLLTPFAEPSALSLIDTLPSNDERITFETLNAAGLQFDFDTLTNSIGITPKPELLQVQQISLSARSNRREINYDPPARTSASLTLRSSTGYEAIGETSGLLDPAFEVSASARVSGLVIESDFTVIAGENSAFDRNFTRLVYDRPQSGQRITALDIFPNASSFLNAPELFGIAIEKQTRLFNPQDNLRTQNYDRFSLQDASTVEVLINGALAQRLDLAAGNYELSDFPLATGSNDVQIIATDRFGRRELSSFSQYFSYGLLAPGETEYSFAFGAQPNFDSQDRSYDFDRLTLSGFYRRGVSGALTLGGAVQGDDITQAASIETSFETRLGTFLSEAAFSNDDQAGAGQALQLVYQMPPPVDQASWFNGFGVSLDYLSKSYTPVGRAQAIENSLAYGITTNASLRITDKDFATVTANYSSLRGDFIDRYEVSAQYNRRIGRDLTLTLAAGYGRSQFGETQPIFRIGLNRRFGRNGFGSATYSSRDERTRLSYSRSSGRGTGATNINATTTIGEDTIGGGGGIYYFANNAELSATHNSAFDIEGDDLVTSRTNVQAGASLLFADGTFALSRPATDSFAIIKRHKTLDDATLFIDRNPEGYFSKSSNFSPAAVNDLGSYSDRTLRVEVPDAPLGYDLGAASFRVNPPYRAGHVMTIGSDFTITAIGTLLIGGEPVVFASGQAELLDQQEDRTVAIFTNRVGRFGALGLKPGKWKIKLNTEPPAAYTLDVPDSGSNLFRAGQLEAE